MNGVDGIRLEPFRQLKKEIWEVWHVLFYFGLSKRSRMQKPGAARITTTSAKSYIFQFTTTRQKDEAPGCHLNW